MAPRPTYRKLGGPEDSADRADAVWSIACFFIARPWRGRGLSRRLIEAAADYAKTNGARLLEAYPVEADATSYRFMGLKPTFAGMGFEEIGLAGRRHVMRRKLSRGDKS